MQICASYKLQTVRNIIHWHPERIFILRSHIKFTDFFYNYCFYVAHQQTKRKKEKNKTSYQIISVINNKVHADQ